MGDTVSDIGNGQEKIMGPHSKSRVSFIFGFALHQEQASCPKGNNF